MDLVIDVRGPEIFAVFLEGLLEMFLQVSAVLLVIQILEEVSIAP